MKGKTNNPNGRPKGRPNRLTKEVKGIIKDILEDYANGNMDYNFRDDFMQMEPGDRVKTAVKMAEFIVPKLQRTQLEDNTTRTRRIDDVISQLTMTENER